MCKKNWWVCWMVAILLAWPASGLRAQSVADVIQQLVLDVQKLAQLKQLLTRMYQEYTMLQKGYEQIKGLSQGTFSLHKLFLDGLLMVSPAVSNYPKVVGILSKEANLIKEYQRANGYFRNSGLFTSQELDGFSSNYGGFLQRGQKDIDELTMVLTAEELRMTDDERLSVIDRLDNDMTKQLSLLRAFNNSASVQAVQRARAGGEINVLRQLHGVGP